MKKIRVAALFVTLSVLIASCVNSGQQELTPTLSGVTTQGITNPQSLPTSAPTETQESLTALNEIEACPSERIVPLENLGLPKQFNLVTLLPGLNKHGDYAVGYSLISTNEPDPLAIDVVPSAGSVNYNYDISPDGQWVSFLRWKKNDPTNRSLWVSSLDGKKQWRVKQFTNIYTSSQWISGNEIVITGYHGDTGIETHLPSYYSMPIAVINPFTLAEQSLSPLSKEYIEEGQDQMFAFRDGSMYDMFRLGHGESYILHNYGDNTYQHILEWLNATDGEATRVFRKGDFFMVMVDRPYGVDLSAQLSLPEIKTQTEYAQMMRKVVLPTKFLPPKVLDILPQSNSLILLSTDMSSPIKWFNLDYQRLQIKNYCYETPWDVSPYISPDEGFVAFSRGYPEYPNGEITILNLNTGYISIITGYQLIGWGIQQ